MTYKTIHRKGEPVKIVAEMSIYEADLVKSGLEILSPDTDTAQKTSCQMAFIFSVAYDAAVNRRKAGR